MMTLITGDRSYESLVGVTAHELAHSWFQHVLATNEMKHEWMDEGFTTYISTLAVNKILNKKVEFPFVSSYGNYFFLFNQAENNPNRQMPIDMITIWLMRFPLTVKELFFLLS